MPSDVPNLATIRERLESLVKCLLTHAEGDAAFAEELVRALTLVRPGRAARARPQVDINLVEILKEKGSEEVIQVLAGLKPEELRELAKRYKVPARSNDMPIEQLIEGLTQKAAERLGRGGVFLDAESVPATNSELRESSEVCMPSEQEEATPTTAADTNGGGTKADVVESTEGNQEETSKNTNA